MTIVSVRLIEIQLNIERGGNKMPDMNLLNQKIKDSGMTVTAIADKSKINRATLYNRLNNKGEWTASEIVGVSTTLRLSKPERDAIFLK